MSAIISFLFIGIYIWLAGYFIYGLIGVVAFGFVGYLIGESWMYFFGIIGFVLGVVVIKSKNKIANVDDGATKNKSIGNRLANKTKQVFISLFLLITVIVGHSTAVEKYEEASTLFNFTPFGFVKGKILKNILKSK